MYRVQCSIIEASLGRYDTHQYNSFLLLYAEYLLGDTKRTHIIYFTR
jgi:hypothetical protein